MKDRLNNTKKAKHPVLRCILLSLLAAAVISGTVFSHFGGFGTGDCADTEEFAKYAKPVADITIPEQISIVALGEATHGNAEFQQLKLDVFKVLVEKYGVRAFALEGDLGGCEAVNRYIQGGEGTAREAAAAIGFPIYRTEQIEQLISWMRSYNLTAADGDVLRFYGFDMQLIEYNYKYLLEAAKEARADTSALEAIWDNENNCYSDAYTSDGRTAVYEDIKKQIFDCYGGDTVQEAAPAAHYADILLQNIEIGKLINSSWEGMALRDKYMADNVMWILEQEKARGNDCIFVSAHNGHVEQFGSYSIEDKVMGNILADRLGDGYFAIGTDFYRSRCLLPNSSRNKRRSHTFYSYDPLAKASMKCGYDISWLDFSAIPENSPLKAQTDDYTWMSSIGDGYSPFMAVMPMAYRIWGAPSEIYDGMIFVSYANPIEIKE